MVSAILEELVLAQYVSNDYDMIVCSGKIDRGVPLLSCILMIEIGNIKEVRSDIYV